MIKWTIYKVNKESGEKLDEIYLTNDVKPLDALADWLDDNCIPFEMIETDEDGKHFAVSGQETYYIED